MTDPFKKHLNLLSSYIKTGLPKNQLTEITRDFLEEPWVKKLLVFSDHVVCIADLKTLNYLYVSPSIENLTGYPDSDFSSMMDLQKVVPADELLVVSDIAGIALKELQSRKLRPSETKRIRFSRNCWGVRKDQTRINTLHHGLILAFDESGMPLIEFIVVTDITAFNNSPHHFYKLALINDDGTEEVLTQGIYEKQIDVISPREQEILEQMIKGNTSEEIAKQLAISVETVKTHRKNILKKTKSENCIDLLRHGYAHGWL